MKSAIWPVCAWGIASLGIVFGSNHRVYADKPTPAPPPVMLEPSVGGGQRIKPIEKVELPKELDQPGAEYWGLFKICVDRTGTVDHVTVLKGTDRAQLDAAWIEQIKAWRHSPYVRDGAAVGFCYPFKMQAQAASQPVMLAPNIGIGQRLTDLSRPEDRPRLPKALNVDGATYWGLFKVCVTAAGEVAGVSITKSTGEPERLDAPWIEVIKRWRYRPYSVNGRAVPFCTPVRLQVSSRSD